MNLIQKFEFEPNQMVVELEFKFKPCDFGAANEGCIAAV